jgi:tripartite-type tricarboxylate transporter receptor subunit TctC
MEELKLASGMPGVLIPYTSSAEMVLSVIEGQSMMSIIDPPPTIPQIKAGKLKPLAVTGNARLPDLPDVPSMAEAGYPSVDMRIWVGVFAPAGTPPAVVGKLEKALHDAIHSPSVVAKLHSLTINPSDDTPAQFKQHIIDDIAKFRAVAKAAHSKFEE